MEAIKLTLSRRFVKLNAQWRIKITSATQRRSRPQTRNSQALSLVCVSGWKRFRLIKVEIFLVYNATNWAHHTAKDRRFPKHTEVDEDHMDYTIRLMHDLKDALENGEQSDHADDSDSSSSSSEDSDEDNQLADGFDGMSLSPNQVACINCGTTCKRGKYKGNNFKCGGCR